MDRRMFYMGGDGKQLVAELDGTTHEADPNDPELIVARERILAYVEADREEWRDHIPSGYEDTSGYGQVSCSCGWDSGNKLGWEEHIDAAEALR